KTSPRKIILRNFQSPGDIVMLTAAVRDLHRAYPGAFITDVRTSCPAIWEHNPWITPLDDSDPEVQILDCTYPLIHSSNKLPYHFIHAFMQMIGEALGASFSPTEFRGDIHISREEQGWMSQIQEITGDDQPFWLIVSGGKYDFTAKWWDPVRLQQVVDHFAGKIRFVQVGEGSHNHPPISGVIDLRGKTDLRQLIRLVYHATGVICPVTLLMHLAAAVPTRADRFITRACVVIAGGREPVHWEAYPGHQFIHTIGALPCCATGGCWKSRVLPLGDGDDKDNPENLCARPKGFLPECMDMITAEDVIHRIDLYRQILDMYA
ncbi:MAG: glycosyltransferase family 9 protein, partial [Bacteroidota bacterium]